MCATCGQVMPDDDDDMPNDPDAKHHGSAAYATKVMELCAIAKAPDKGLAFVKAKMPLAKVRAELAALAARTVDATSIDGTAKPAGEAEVAVAKAWDDVVAKINEGLPQAKARR